ncbi:MAG: peptidoglycan DD-metalloendopeptidase family protein [Sarcina sp.]
MSILTNLESRGVLDNEKKMTKSTTDSKFKTYRRTHEDRVRNMLRNESIHQDEDLDPYSKTATKRNSSKVMSLANTGYQTTLLEKILQAQSNPELAKTDMQFKQKTIELLSEVRDALQDIRKGQGTQPTQERREETKKRPTSELARDIAEMNVGGIMNHMRTSLTSGADKYGLVSLGGAIKDMIKGSLESGAFGDIVKDGIQSGLLSLLGGRNKAMVMNFKNDPIQAIQDGINLAGLSRSPLGKLFAPHMTKTKLDPSIAKSNKDVNAPAIFDYRTHTSINTVIPDLLSRLVAQVEGKERTKFDHEKQKWVTVSQILEEYASKDNASKYTKDIINKVRMFMVDGSNKNKGSRSYDFIQRDKDNKIVRNSDNKAMMKDDQSFIVVMNEVAKSGITMSELLGGDASKVVKEYKLFNESKGVDESKAVAIVKIIQDGMGAADIAEVNEADYDFRERLQKLNTLKEHSLMTSDINKNEIKLHSKVKTGITSYSNALKDMYGDSTGIRGFVSGGNHKAGQRKTIRTGNLNYDDKIRTADKNYKNISTDKYLFGTMESRKEEYNISSRGYEATEDELNQIKYAELKAKKLISEREYKKLLDGDKDEKLNDKVKAQTKRLSAAWNLFSTFDKDDATAWGMAKSTGQSAGYWASKGFFEKPDQCIEYINEDGSIDHNKLRQRNAKFTAAYIADLKKRNETNERGIGFDITNPAESSSEILNSIFSDPSVAKKLGIGTGSVAGYAMGKLINNNTFIKSPKLGYLLGAVGAGIMSMERTQHYLNQTLGPAGSVAGESGYSNREILMAKMFNKWLPAVGLGGKAAQLTYKFMSKMGPVGTLLGPVGALAVGGTVAAMTPGLIKIGKKTLFDDDGKGNKGILKSLGRSLRNIPGVNEIFGGPRDNRTDEEMMDSTLVGIIRETDDRIKELQDTPKRSDAEEEELKKLKSYRSELLAGRERLGSIIKTDDAEVKSTEFKRFKTDFLDKNSKVQQQYSADIIKRDKKNTLGDATDAKITIKSKDELGKLYAKRLMEKYEGVNIDKLTPSERKEYDLANDVSSGKSITGIFQKNLEAYLNQEGSGMEKIATQLYEGNSLATKLGYSTIHGGWTDEKGDKHKGLMDLNTTEEYNAWLASLNPKSQKYVSDYVEGRRKLNTMKENLREIAGLSVDSTTPGLGPREREIAIENLIKNGMVNSKNVKQFIANKFNIKKKDVVNKMLTMFDAGGVDTDTLTKEGLYANKLESLMGGGQGSSNVNELVKMKDLKSYKFKNGSRLSLAGCSIVAFNNALNMLGIGGISIEYLIEIANSYLTTDGGVTADFMRDVANRINLNCKIFNSIDNSFDNELLMKFKPTTTKAVILLLKNSNGNGSHFINLRAINKTKAIIDDPETTGVTEISTSTLVASLLEVITLEKVAVDMKLKETPGEVHKTRSSEYILNSLDRMPPKSPTSSSSPNSTNVKQMTSDFAKGTLPSNSKENDNVLNVRIVEDLTLPLHMTDQEAAMSLSRKLRSSSGGSKVASKYGKKTEEMRKQRGMMKEYLDAQKTQDDIGRTADAIEGASLGAGGAGTGEAALKSEPQKFGMIEGIGKTIAGIIGGATTVALSNYVGSIKDSLLNVLSSEDGMDENGKPKSADMAGHVSRTRMLVGQGVNLAKTGWSAVKSVFKGSTKAAWKFGKGLVDIKDKAGAVSDFVGDTAKNIGKTDDLLMSITKMADGLADFPDKLWTGLNAMLNKVPFLGAKVQGAANSKGGRKIWARISKALKGLITKFTGFIPKNISKAIFKALPGASLIMTLVGSVLNFLEGYRKAHMWLEIAEKDAGFLMKIFTGILKVLYEELPNLLAAVLALIPGVGPIIGFVSSLCFMFLQDEYGGFKGFLEFIGIKDANKYDEDIINDPLTKIDSNGNIVVKLSEKNDISANMDKATAKKRNDDGTYNFTKDKTKNDNANKIYDMIRDKAKAKGINSSMAMAQWATESAWGTSDTLNQQEAKDANVLFGVKKGSDWKGKTVKLMTTEYVDAKDLDKWKNKEGFEIVSKEGGKVRIRVIDEFRAYDSQEEAVDDYLNVLSNYKNGLDGYATDPGYANTIASLMGSNFNTQDMHNDYGMSELAKANMANGELDIKMLASGYTNPLSSDDYLLTSAYGMRTINGNTRMHRGVDFKAKEGDPVTSITDGVVTYAADSGAGGNTVRVKHADGTESEYMHLSKIGVKVGDKVGPGFKIGEVGNTGTSFGAHLHLGIKKGNQHLDPVLALGLDPAKLRLNNSDPENFAWLENNKGYTEKYSKEIKRMADEKIAKQEQEKLAQSIQQQHKQTSREIGKGGPQTPYIPTEDSKDKQRIIHLENQNTRLMEALETMNTLLGKIVKNTEINSNNIMNEAMGLNM